MRIGLHTELLESRVLLAASSVRSIYAVDNILDTPTTQNLADVKAGPMSNTAVGLTNLYRTYRKYRNAGGIDGDFGVDDNIYLVEGNRVGVTIRSKNGIDSVTTTVRKFGGEIITRSAKYGVVDALVPIGQLHSLARQTTVATVNPLYRQKTRQAGISNNQSDEAHNSDKARSIYGLDGTGVKIGVISDSANLVTTGLAGSIATGDLPASGVQIITDSRRLLGGADEGRAMLELIHDIAPGADLAFAAAGLSQLEFAQAIQSLSASGCNVIVDDIGFTGEPFFQPGILEDAVNDFVNGGGVYVAALGNDARDGYEAETNFVSVNRALFVDFDSGPAVDTRLRVELNGGTFQLQWDNPYNGVAGNTTTDLDIYVYDPTFPKRIVAFGSANNLRTGIPTEDLISPHTGLPTFLFPGRYDIEIRVADRVPGRPLPTRFKFAGTFGLVSTEFTDGITASTQDHAAGENVLSIGAVGYYSAPPTADVGEDILSESFSSFGPATRVFDSNGNRLPSVLTLQKPDISGIDDVNTSFFGFFPGLLDSGTTGGLLDSDVLPNFTGTSAAAPNVAAVIALIRQAAPDATQDQIKSALIASATPLNGAPIGEWDPQGGFGLINAQLAVEQFVTAPTVKINRVTPDPTDSPVSSVKFVFSQQIDGFDISDLILSVDGGPNLLTGGNEVVMLDGGRSFLLTNLADLTTDPGTYTLELLEFNEITNTIDLDLGTGAIESWTKIPPPPPPANPSNLATKVISDTEVRLRWSDNSSNEDGFTIQRADNEAFSLNVKTFHVNSANTAVFTDKLTPTGRPLFYRVRAFNNFSGHSGYSNIAKATTLSPGEIILDNESSSGVRVTGSWNTSSSISGFTGSSYLDDDNSGKGSKSVRYTPNFEFTGDYFVYARWTRSTNRATNVPYEIVSDDGKTTVTVNQRNRGGNGWVLLGKFNFRRGTFGSVTISTGGTNGHVIADSVRFQSAEGGTSVPPTSS